MKNERISLIGNNEINFKNEVLEILDNLDLLYYLTWRDIKVRYKQTVLGILWIILQPIISTILFTFLFGGFAKIPSDNIPYPIFVFIGLLYWNFFANVLTNTSNCLIANENVLKKVYFPRLITLLSSGLSGVIDVVPNILILLVLLIIYKVSFSLLSIAVIVGLLLLVFVSAFGLGSILAPINARFRDVRYVLPYFIQIGMFLTPVFYPTSLFGGTSKLMRIINPPAEAIEVSRSFIFGTRPFDPASFTLSLIVTFSIAVTGIYLFKKTEKSFVDIL